MIHNPTVTTSTYGAGTSQAVCPCGFRGQAYNGDASLCAANEADQHRADPDAPANRWAPIGRAS